MCINHDFFILLHSNLKNDIYVEKKTTYYYKIVY